LLQRQGKVNYETVIQGRDNGFNLERFTSLYRDWWGKKQDERFYAHLKKFSDTCASQSWIQMDFLSVNGKDIAAMLHCRYDSSLLMYLMAVDKTFNEKISIGNILVGLCLEKAISNGIKAYDFLKGNEIYKFHWANSGRRSLSVKFYQKHLGSLGKLSVELAKDFARALLR
jgi:CelD/BcsL family acetyltransferase involved in cellulose biosynthesis